MNEVSVLKKILIADDDEGIYELLSSLVREMGYQPEWAFSAAAARTCIEVDPPFLLILDFGLPDMNALELLEELGGSGIRLPPFVLSTGQGDERIAVSMMKLGARDYVIKDTLFLDRIPDVLKRVCTELENEQKLVRTESALRNSEALVLGFFEQAPISVHVVDTNGLVLNVNRAFEKLWNIPADQVVGHHNVISDLHYVKTGFADFLRPAFAGEVCDTREIVYDPADFGDGGEKRILSSIAFPLKDDNRIRSIVILQNDVTKQRQAEARIHQLAFYDSLTGLPNRTLMMDRISQRISFLQRHTRHDVLILLNIDRFKVINDARGNRIGDAILEAFGVRLQSLMRDAHTVARMTGDEFAILLPNDETDSGQVSFNSLAITERIRDSLHRNPLSLDGEKYSITVSLGLTLLPENPEDTPDSVIRRSDTALHRAKDSGGNQCAFFEAGMGESASESYQVERDLGQAVANGELRLYLQPQLDARGKCTGAECLLRWQHPSRGLLSPNLFIPIAEQSDLIVELGSWVMGEACKILSDPAACDPDIRISVNVSPRHFRKATFVPWLTSILRRTGADPSRLTLEITESLFINNIQDVIDKMNELVAAGIHFSIDDFGTGYSSLSYLKRLPIQELKIDKSFVQDAPTDSNDAALVETILAVAAHMHLGVVAEGVETGAQASFLNARADVVHQGYLFGRPEPAEFWLEKWRNRT